MSPWPKTKRAATNKRRNRRRNTWCKARAATRYKLHSTQTTHKVKTSNAQNNPNLHVQPHHTTTTVTPNINKQIQKHDRAARRRQTRRIGRTIPTGKAIRIGKATPIGKRQIGSPRTGGREIRNGRLITPSGPITITGTGSPRSLLLDQSLYPFRVIRRRILLLEQRFLVSGLRLRSVPLALMLTTLRFMPSNDQEPSQVIAAVQNALSQAGYEPGPVDNTVWTADALCAPPLSSRQWFARNWPDRRADAGFVRHRLRFAVHREAACWFAGMRLFLLIELRSATIRRCCAPHGCFATGRARFAPFLQDRPAPN